ncbi:hypothetical protein C8R43DRAFT_1134175 [Mycena crocata]|nr:hypothetical protein C8R43DRAFT_1134175 [Mycena crocata]
MSLLPSLPSDWLLDGQPLWYTQDAAPIPFRAPQSGYQTSNYRFPAPTAPDNDLDALNFRETRSGRVFSSWEEISAGTFDIAAAVSHAVELQINEHEDLTELDSGRPRILLAAHTPSTSTSSIPSVPPPTLHHLPPQHPPVPRAPPPALHPKKRKNSSTLLTRSKPQPQTPFWIPALATPRHLKKITVSPIRANFSLHKICIASTGWIGLRDHGVAPQEAAAGSAEDGPRPTHKLSDFFGPSAIFRGFTLVKYADRHARPIVDCHGKVCAVYGGKPDDEDFMKTIHDPAVEAMELARAQASLADDRTFHRRGNWASLTAGDSHGGGQVQPGALVNGIINTTVLCCLLIHFSFIRFAGFATGLFANWAPELFDFYVDYMGAFYKRYSHLHRPFLNGIWSAVTFNLGPYTCALGHRDFANLAFGWCAITALGYFNYQKGGHLILWDCHLVLEFPPGCTILIPSAAIFHSNIPISNTERRYSFTQYTAGGLFRWVEHGFKTEEEYMATLTRREREEEEQLGLERAREGARMFSTLEELCAM